MPFFIHSYYCPTVRSFIYSSSPFFHNISSHISSLFSSFFSLFPPCNSTCLLFFLFLHIPFLFLHSSHISFLVNLSFHDPSFCILHPFTLHSSFFHSSHSLSQFLFFNTLLSYLPPSPSILITPTYHRYHT